MKRSIQKFANPFMVALFSFSIIVLRFPWQIIPFDSFIQGIFDFILHLCWIIPVVFCLGQIQIKPLLLKRFILGIGFLIVFMGLFKATEYFTIGYSMKSIYSVFYNNPSNPNENILVIHNHLNGLTSWNETKHIVKFPEWGFQIEKDFDQEDLSGTWFVHPDNPFCELEGEVVFFDGKSI